MTAIRATAVALNCAAAFGWTVFLLKPHGSSWLALGAAAPLVVPALANVAALMLARGAIGRTADMVLVSLVLADGIGFVLWMPAVLLLTIVCFGTLETNGVAALALGCASAVGLAAAARTLLTEAGNERAV